MKPTQHHLRTNIRVCVLFRLAAETTRRCGEDARNELRLAILRLQDDVVVNHVLQLVDDMKGLAAVEGIGAFTIVERTDMKVFQPLALEEAVGVDVSVWWYEVQSSLVECVVDFQYHSFELHTL